jgi:hypothetical protein
MKVKVNTFANLRDYAPGGRVPIDLSLPDGATVADLLAALGDTPAINVARDDAIMIADSHALVRS